MILTNESLEEFKGLSREEKEEKLFTILNACEDLGLETLFHRVTGLDYNFDIRDLADDEIETALQLIKENRTLQSKLELEDEEVEESLKLESNNPLKDAQKAHRKKNKGLSPFSYLNPGDVEKGIETFNKNMTSNTSNQTNGESTSSGEGMGESFKGNIKDVTDYLKLIARKSPNAIQDKTIQDYEFLINDAIEMGVTAEQIKQAIENSTSIDDLSKRIYELSDKEKYKQKYGENLQEDMERKTYKEELRIWGDEEISAQNSLVKWEHALEDFLENNNIEYDQVKCDIFDYGTNVVIINPKDIEEVAQEIEDHYGFKTTIEDNNIYVDVTEEYEDEYGDIKTRVAKRYDESLDSEVTLQELADKINYNGADYRGAEIPKAIDYMINQINIPDNMRLKWFDVDVVSDDVIQLTYVTQEPFSPTDSDSFIKEVTNMINVLANKYRYDKPFTLALDVTARDGRDEGQLVYDIKVNAGTDMSLKEDISNKKYTLESKLYDYFKATNPNDPFGDDIDKEATFRDLFNAINDNANVYKVIFGNENSGDSVVREELFNGLANILNTSYSDVYDAWLGYHPLLESNNIIDIRKELNRLDSEEYRDLLNMYDSIELAEHEKKHIAELISQNKIDELVDYLQELYYVYINVYDGNSNGIVTNDLGTFYKKDDLLDDGKFYKHEGLNDKTLKEDIDWDYFDKFEPIINKYMPDRGEGETMASQIVTAVNKLIYKWYNDGDVYDNTRGLPGWANDLSDYANWLYKYVPKTQYTLDLIEEVSTDGGYEEILQLLADLTLNEEFLSKYTDEKCLGSIYNCNGPFKFIDLYDDDEDDDSTEDW